jgi:hypothetical protein
VSAVWVPLTLAYLSLGVLLLIGLLAERRPRDRDDPSLVELTEAADPARQNRWYRVRRDILAPGLTGLLVVLAWPGALVWTAKLKLERWLQDRSIAAHEASRIFAVKRGDLVNKVEVAAVEAKETVFDPLGAAPAVPFGFLNPQWHAFLAKGTPADAVWSFRALRDGDWGLLDERTGYALVRCRKVVAFMVASIEHKERPSSSSAGTSKGDRS